MTSILVNDAASAINTLAAFKGHEMIPLSQVKVVRVISAADFKSKHLDFARLRPAILFNQAIII